MKIKFLHIGILFSIFAFTACSGLFKSPATPNVIIIVADDFGWGDVGFNGNQIIHTPTLDSIEKHSVVIDKFYVSPTGEQTFISLLTGKYGLKNINNEATLPKAFNKKGYSTACFGKWYSDIEGELWPQKMGFDYYLGFKKSEISNYFSAEMCSMGNKIKTNGYVTDVITDSTVNYLKRNSNEFFVVVSYANVKSASQTQDKYLQNNWRSGIDNRTAAVYGQCENIDYSIHRILQLLKEINQIDNTILIFMSDNGPGYVRYNGGLKGRRGQVDEGGVRVPFLVHYPNGKLKNRNIRNGFASHIDVMPTLVNMCALAATNKEYTFDGIDISAVLKTTSPLPSRDYFTYQYLNKNAFSGAIRNCEFLLTCSPNDTALYNLKDDPYQLKNLKYKNVRLTDSLGQLYDNWLITNGIKNNNKESALVSTTDDKVLKNDTVVFTADKTEINK